MAASRKTRRAARRLYHLCLVDGLLDEARARQVAGRLAASAQRGSLAILEDFLRLVRLDVARRTAVVESAAPLPEAVRDSVSAGLTSTYGPGVQTSFAINPALVGGMRVKVGSDVYDGSVRARLAALEARL
jgi:F-type H+-transporting ATPase subunit delta